VARITIEDCLDKVDNRFQLVHMAAKRVRQIREGSEYLVSSPKNEDIVVALREIAAGKVVVRKDGDAPQAPEAAEALEAPVEAQSPGEQEAAGTEDPGEEASAVEQEAEKDA